MTEKCNIQISGIKKENMPKLGKEIMGVIEKELGEGHSNEVDCMLKKVAISLKDLSENYNENEKELSEGEILTYLESAIGKSASIPDQILYSYAARLAFTIANENWKKIYINQHGVYNKESIDKYQFHKEIQNVTNGGFIDHADIDDNIIYVRYNDIENKIYLEDKVALEKAISDTIKGYEGKKLGENFKAEYVRIVLQHFITHPQNTNGINDLAKEVGDKGFQVFSATTHFLHDFCGKYGIKFNKLGKHYIEIRPNDELLTIYEGNKENIYQ